GGGLYAGRGDGEGKGMQVVARLRQERGAPGRQASPDEVLQRLVYPMVDEAFRCLDDKIVAAEQDLDLGLVMGIGFPPFLGGITGFAQRQGLRTIVAALDELARAVDPRLQPSDGLRRRALA